MFMNIVKSTSCHLPVVLYIVGAMKPKTLHGMNFK
jgi:hypothetical protein